MNEREQLHRDGFALLRGAVPADWLEGLRSAFDAGVKPSAEWPVPRGQDWQHALLDLDAGVRAVCRLPALLAVVGALIGERFFLAQVAGREPCPTAAGSGCTGTSPPSAPATPSTPWSFSTTTAPTTAPPALSPAATAPTWQRLPSTSTTSPMRFN